MIREDPWLGAGPLHFAHHAQDLQIAAHPHNWPLQIGSEWGLPALLLLCSALALAMRKLWQLRKIVAAKDQDTLTAWLVTGLAILLDGLVSGLLVMPTSQLWIALYVGCVWGWSTAQLPFSKPIAMRPSRLHFVLLTLGALLLLYALVNGIWPELKELDVRNGSYAETKLFSPRVFINSNF
jgi:O-antigen ligase